MHCFEGEDLSLASVLFARHNLSLCLADSVVLKGFNNPTIALLI